MVSCIMFSSCFFAILHEQVPCKGRVLYRYCKSRKRARVDQNASIFFPLYTSYNQRNQKIELVELLKHVVEDKRQWQHSTKEAKKCTVSGDEYEYA